MLRSLKALERYTLHATDGHIGHVVDFLLDDQRWVTRYLVADTGDFLDGRRVLISPISLREAKWETRQLYLALTKDKIKRSPSVDVDKPVSRQQERDHLSYYGYASYIGYSGVWGMGPYPSLLTGGNGITPPPRSAKDDEAPGDVHLRSAHALRGYHIQGTDGAIGHVEDFVIDDETWEVRYLVIDTSNWWFGKKVLVAPLWASQIRWEDRTVHVAMSRDEVKRSPPWDPAAAVNRELEARLYDYYGRPVYWERSASPDANATAHL